MRKESGEVTSEREEILKICADFYKALCTQMSAQTGKYNEIPEFTEEEVERAIKRMKRLKAQGMGGITNDIIKLAGQVVLAYVTNIFNNILTTKQIPDIWHEANIVILFETGDPKDIKFRKHYSTADHLHALNQIIE